MVKEVGAPQLTPRGLHHQSATPAKEAGIRWNHLQEHVGHASVTITADIYALLTSCIIEEATLKIEHQLFRRIKTEM